MNKEEKYDAGPLLTLKKELNIEELKKNVSLEDRFIDLIIKNINKARWGQRFAVNWRANKDQEFIISIGATLPNDASEKDIKELKEVCGQAIVAQEGGRNKIVHEELDTIEFMHAVRQGTSSVLSFNECIYRGGLSFTIGRKTFEEIFKELELAFIDHSTRQFDSQEINSLAMMSLFYSLGDDKKIHTIYNPENNEFINRTLTLQYQIHKSSISFITKLVADAIVNALEEKCNDGQLRGIDFVSTKRNYTDCQGRIFNKIWEENFRYNKPNIADQLLTTICIACGYNDTKEPGPRWVTIADDEIVFRAIAEAEKYGIKLDLNKIPDRLKNICGQPDFSTTALMFAAKKTDIDKEKRLKLITFLIEQGADPAQKDKEGHNAIRYAKSSGNTEIAKYLSSLMKLDKSDVPEKIDNQMAFFKRTGQSADDKPNNDRAMLFS